MKIENFIPSEKKLIRYVLSDLIEKTKHALSCANNSDIIAKYREEIIYMESINDKTEIKERVLGYIEDSINIIMMDGLLISRAFRAKRFFLPPENPKE